ncbi:cytochrome P450 [Candidatus Poriferisocius sp.]|uniref:cytochrome P450 n=1 Tax=Candidatus Poriferisocius sp. TaxID=3101276 RepID=UPI003B5CF4B9
MDVDALDLISPRRYGANGQPHELLAWLRQNSPVHWCEPEGFQNFWAITRHADIIEVSTQPEVFSNEADGIVVLSDQQVADQKNGPSAIANMRTIISMDPPDHRLYRKVASGFFTPRGISQLDQIVHDSAQSLLDSLGDEGECDFVDIIAQRHPLRVLATILGIDRDDEEQLLVLTQQLLSGDDPDYRREAESRYEASQQVGMEFYAMFDRIIKDRRTNPTDDLASMLAHAHLPTGEPLGEIETFGYYLIVFVAGHDTTRNALSGALEAFLAYPDQLQRLREHPELLKDAVEEVVRWSTPVNYMKRTVMADATVAGQPVKEGEFLMLLYASGNRDEAVFDRPHDFDIGRHPNRHLGFGWAEHYCLGAHLARASTQALIQQMAERVVEIEPAGPAVRTESNLIVGTKQLPVRYKLRPAA